ncbi:hypothetical protein BOX15_Mlig028822g1 [Macrostomum lignano]|uniref:TNFR-Cys domain-containing protein n=2 Tax=Macrostomum lignano TaxID=282301 RepID=A0A1I8HG65_9PLAT|nr:hypothetical protein BOX15_Mlig028822g1 [Macrostomum lignano]
MTQILLCIVTVHIFILAFAPTEAVVEGNGRELDSRGLRSPTAAVACKLDQFANEHGVCLSCSWCVDVVSIKDFQARFHRVKICGKYAQDCPKLDEVKPTTTTLHPASRSSKMTQFSTNNIGKLPEQTNIVHTNRAGDYVTKNVSITPQPDGKSTLSRIPIWLWIAIGIVVTAVIIAIVLLIIRVCLNKRRPRSNSKEGQTAPLVRQEEGCIGNSVPSIVLAAGAIRERSQI